MKTIEERAKEYAQKAFPYSPYYFEATRKEYIKIMTEQKAIDIDKACEWLDTYLMEIGYPDDWLRDSPNMESGKERFRKAMEE